jgi:alkylation response protein AidB-like acyl-CoA dehydrogenase
MTITDITDIDSRHDLLDRAAAVGRDIAGHADGHDRDGTFVTEAFEQLRDSGLLAMAVPTELGGAGATIRQVAAVQQELGRHDGSAALASAMHQHVVAFTAWRYRRGMPGAEATLRRVADDGIVVLSTGGGDFSRPRGTAVRVDGGFRVSGTKPFVSQAPVGAVLSTMFVLDDPERGRRVLNMAVPVASDGVAVLDDWDALGMRGTGSHSVAFHDVFVPDERVLADRPYGVIDGPLQVIVSIAMPIISAAYLGVAQAAYEAAVRAAVAGADDPLVQRQVGLMAHRLQVAQWSLDGALDEIGDDPTPSLQGLGAALAAKREVALAGVEVTDLAMEVAGGSAYFRGSPIERAYRDVRAAKFHPLTPELTLLNAGRTALGLPADEA